MDKPEPSLEELAVEHGVNLAFLQRFQAGLAQANAAQDRWVSWRKPLIAKARQIEALVRAYPK